MNCSASLINNGSITSTGSNCGIAKGGFQQGNKCASGGSNGPKTKGSQGIVGTAQVKDSLAVHTDESGQLSQARREIHARIIESHFDGKTPVSNPVATVMGGGPAAGKSTILNPAMGGTVKLDKNSIVINADDIKFMLPEWADGQRRKDMGMAAYLHEESAVIAKAIQDKASRGRYNSVLDGTGNGELEKLRGKVNRMKDAGQKVVAHYVTVSTQEALNRNKERAKKEGRIVPEAEVKALHRGVSKILGQAIKEGLFDEVTVWDTEQGGPPVKIAESKGSALNVINQKLWRKFQLKGSEKL